MMLFVSLIAAVLLPASTIATIFALFDAQMNESFWHISELFTFIMLAAFVLPLLKRKITMSKGS